jgi:VWFA-related protein
MRLGIAGAVAATGLVALAALRPGAAAAQDPGAVRESVDVSLVEVPVRVLDKAGEPVRGLTRADFTLFDQGRPQEILGFDEIDLAERGDPERAGPIPPAARRRFLILFDLSFARPRTVVAARRAALAFVQEGLRDGDLAAVATYMVERGVSLLVTFSSDRGQLAAAIESLGVAPGQERLDPLLFTQEDRLRLGPGMVREPAGRGETRPGTGAAAGREGQVALNDNLRTLASLSQARNDDYERGRVRSLMQSFRELGKALDAVEGRKDIIFLSEGFQSHFLVGTQETEEEQSWLVRGEAWKVDSDRRFGSAPLLADLSDMGESLRRTGCVVHTVDIAGIATEADARNAGDAGAHFPRFTKNALFELAEQTGGVTIRSTDDLDAELARLTRGSSRVYVLAFRPDRTDGEGKYHALKVKVAPSGVRAVARPGYFERRDFRQRTALERSLSAADIIANEIPSVDVPARVLAATFPPAAAGEAALVSVLVEVPGAAFLADEKGEHTALEVFGYAFDASDRLSGFFAQSIGVDVARGRAGLAAGGVRYFSELRLPPGDFRLRTFVRNANTGRSGLVVTPLRVPEFRGEGPYLMAPIFLEAASADWVSIRGKVESAPAGPGPAAMPFGGLAGEAFVPAAAPRLAPGSSARLCVIAYRFGSDAGETFKIASQVLAADGRYLSAGALSLLGKTAPDAEGKRVFLLSFTAPGELAPGRYGLRVLVEAAASGQARQGSASFSVP